MDEFKNLKIKDLNEDDRPREKMMKHGASSLSDAELLAILIGSGSKNETAIALCRRILQSVHHNLNELGRVEVKSLVDNFHGIGEAKAITILAALELGRRRKQSEVLNRDKIVSSRDVFEKMHPQLADLSHEEFWVLLLNQASKVLDTIKISQGGLSETTVDLRIIFKAALLAKASAMVLCHNHPSGNNKASSADVKLTEKIVSAGKIMGIAVLDHIIVAESSYYSFADEGMI